MRHGFIKDKNREGRGLATTRINEESQLHVKGNLKYEENKAERLRNTCDEAYDWYLEAFHCYEEGLKEIYEVKDENAEFKIKLSETASTSSSSPTFATKVFRKEDYCNK